jgi:hypothetical protein
MKKDEIKWYFEEALRCLRYRDLDNVFHWINRGIEEFDAQFELPEGRDLRSGLIAFAQNGIYPAYTKHGAEILVDAFLKDYLKSKE